MEDVKKRIREARLRAGLTQQQLANAIGVSRGAVGNWESLTNPELPTLANLALVAGATGTTRAWLVGGASRDAIPHPVRSTPVPLVDWQRVTEAGPIVSHEEEKANELACPVPVGPGSFALRVRGRPMVSANPLEMSYPEGSIIFCDPSIIDRIDTERVPVIVWVPERGESVFRMLVWDGSVRWLEALNSEYGRIEEPFSVRAIVVGAFRETGV